MEADSRSFGPLSVFHTSESFAKPTSIPELGFLFEELRFGFRTKRIVGSLAGSFVPGILYVVIRPRPD
jgi:hypothetical protein